MCFRLSRRLCAFFASSFLTHNVYASSVTEISVTSRPSWMCNIRHVCVVTFSIRWHWRQKKYIQDISECGSVKAQFPPFMKRYRSLRGRRLLHSKFLQQNPECAGIRHMQHRCELRKDFMCRNHGIDFFAGAELLVLCDRAFKAGEREANTGRSADKFRRRVEDKAKELGLSVRWPGLWPSLFNHKGDINLPSV